MRWSLNRACNYKLFRRMTGVVERIAGHQDQVLPFDHGDTHLLIAIQDLCLLHDISVGRAVGHGDQDFVPVVDVLQDKQMVPVAVAVDDADAFLPRLGGSGQPAGSLVQGGCLHIPRHGDVLAQDRQRERHAAFHGRLRRSRGAVGAAGPARPGCTFMRWVVCYIRGRCLGGHRRGCRCAGRRDRRDREDGAFHTRDTNDYGRHSG